MSRSLLELDDVALGVFELAVAAPAGRGAERDGEVAAGRLAA